MAYQRIRPCHAARASTAAAGQFGWLAKHAVGAVLLGLAAQASAVQPAEPGASRGQTHVTFAGFQAIDHDSCRIWVQLSASVQVELSSMERSLTYRLRGAHVPGENNRRPLLTQHFGCQIASVRLENDASDALLIVQLQGQVSARHALEPRDTGGASLYVVIDAEPPDSTR